MSRDWTDKELQAASAAMKAAGHMSYEEFCEEMDRQTEQTAVKYEKLSIWDDPFDIACGDCEVHTHETWDEITEEELHEFHEECIEADINTPDYQKRDYEAMTGKAWEDTPDDFGEFVAQMIADGVLRVKEETA
ncbi:MAG: hypothetical protein LIP11_05985 [Clostridiales bacterium]|nr:hypothetical protein [Clostridiales bacterium]